MASNGNRPEKARRTRMRREPLTHYVKSWCHLYGPFARGEKTHDLRIMDRDYQVGDYIVLQEYDKQTETYLGRSTKAEITYITSDQHVACAFSPTALRSDHAILSLKKVDDK
jgi:Domain of unknown function (DUF3850)